MRPYLPKNEPRRFNSGENSIQLNSIKNNALTKKKLSRAIKNQF